MIFRSWESFDKLLLNRFLEADPTFRWCANNRCSAGQFVHDGGTDLQNSSINLMSIDSTSYFICIKCSVKSCFSCRTLAHPNLTCPQYQAFLIAEQTPVDAATAQWIQKNTKKCRCKVPIEKNDGCEHMTCTRCKSEWCWLCGADYNEIRSQGNTAHERSCPHYAWVRLFVNDVIR